MRQLASLDTQPLAMEGGRAPKMGREIVGDETEDPWAIATIKEAQAQSPEAATR